MLGTPWGSKFFWFHADFGKFGKIVYWCPPGGRWWPPFRKYWILYCNVSLFIQYKLRKSKWCIPASRLKYCSWFFFQFFFGIFAWIAWSAYYHRHMWVGNVFSHVCLPVCLSVCLSVCLHIIKNISGCRGVPVLGVNLDLPMIINLHSITINLVPPKINK